MKRQISISLLVGVALAGCGGSKGSTTPQCIASPANGGPMVSTLAGTGVAGNLDGAGGRSGAATFSSPEGLAFDGAGNLYVADYGNDAIRKVDPCTGTVSTFAHEATLVHPTGVTVDGSGAVIATATDAQQVDRIDTQQTITVVAGNGTEGEVDGSGGASGSAEFSGPSDVVLDQQGFLWVTDYAAGALRRIDPNGTVTTVASALSRPHSLAMDSHGNLYVAEESSHQILQIRPDGTEQVFAGGGFPGANDGQASVARFNDPMGVAVDTHDNVYVADFGNNEIRMIDPSGNVSTIAGNGTPGFVDGAGGATGTAELNQPIGVAVAADGTIFVSDFGNNAIRVIKR